MPYLIAIADSSSVFSFTILILPAYSVASSSRIGATARQGPHQTAQKSTSTGIELFNTASSKVAAVTGVAALIVPLPLDCFLAIS